jgi:ribosomal protein S24E
VDIKVIEKKEEPLLSRTKIIAELFFKGATPSKQEFKKKLASTLKQDENLIVVNKIIQNFGSGRSESIAYIYQNKQDMDKIEPKKKQKEPKKEESKEEPKKEEKTEGKKPQEEVKKEEKAEDKKEVKKTDEKKAEDKKEDIKKETEDKK